MSVEAIKKLYETKTAFDAFVERASNGLESGLGIDKLQSYAQQYIEGKTKGLKKFVIDAYCNGGIDINKVFSALVLNDEEFHIAKTMYEFFVPLGIIMLILYLLLDVLNTTTSRIRDFDMKSFLMIFFKGGIGLIFLKYGFNIMGNLLSVSNTITQAVMNEKVITNSGATNAVFDKLYGTMLAAVNKLSLMDLIGLVLSAVVLQLTQIIPEILILFQAISRKIEIIFRTGIAPISLPDIYNGISNSKAITYIKRFAVILMHGPIMLVIIKVAYWLQGNHVSAILAAKLADQKAGVPALSIVIEMGLYGFAAAGLIGSAKTALNDALGC